LLLSTAIGTIKKDIDVTIPDGNDRRDGARSDAVEIELGAIGSDLRYWRAKEGMRQGEERLEAQSVVRTALKLGQQR
jgi:hypothetical protein